MSRNDETNLVTACFACNRGAANTTRANMSRYGEARKFKYFCAICWRLLKEREGE